MNNFEIIHHTICRRYIELFKNCPTILNYVPKMVDRVTRKDYRGQVTLLAYFFRKSLQPQDAEKISDEIVVRLGVANLAGWIAYRIYDDFLDNEGKAELLSLAHMSLRYCMALYRELLPKEALGTFESFMNKVDETNALEREISYKPKVPPDYKNYEILGYKSLPHCLGPVTILLTLGYTTNSPEIKSCVSFFYHYLIARQLSDDALDWKKDLERGFVNPVAAKILLHPGNPETVFKNKVKDEVIYNIKSHTSRALAELNKNQMIQYKEYLHSLLNTS